MFVAIILFIFGIMAALAGCFFALGGFANVQIMICALLLFLISAVLIGSSFIIGAILDMEKCVKDRLPPAPPKLP